MRYLLMALLIYLGYRIVKNAFKAQGREGTGVKGKPKNNTLDLEDFDKHKS